jgi:hypothetical protein
MVNLAKAALELRHGRLIILAIFSIFFGYIAKDIYIGLGSAFFANNSLFIHPSHEIMIETEFAVPTFFKLLPFISTIIFSSLAIVLSEFLPKLLMSFKFTRFGYNLFGFFNQRFLVELFYNRYVTGLVLKLGGHTTKILDKDSIELIGPYGLEKGLLILSKNIASLDTGIITSYALYILTGLVFYILVLYLTLIDESLLILIIFGLFSVIKTGFVIKQQTFIRSRVSTYSPVGGLHLRKRHLNRLFHSVSFHSSAGLGENYDKDNLLVPPKSIDNLSDSEFFQWLAGFTDAEGCFPFAYRSLKTTVCSFEFCITLHKDDVPLLRAIQTRLNIGNVNIRVINNIVIIRVVAQ